MKDDHTLFGDKYVEYDKRLHQVVEYVREKCDDKTVLKQEDLYKLSVDLDDKIVSIQAQVNKIKKQTEELNDCVANNDLVIDEVRSDQFRKIELNNARVKDYVAKEMQAV